MKKLFILINVLLIALFVNAQYPTGRLYPVNQSIGSDSTLVTSKGGLKGRLINFVFADTTTANLQPIKNYAGAQIVTYKPSASDSGTIWLRNGTATKWLRGSGSIDVTSITFDNDTTGIICFSNGVCDTFQINNLTNVVNNIVQNFNDSTVYNINDSTLVICNGAGVCDTIHLGNSNTYYFLSPDSLVTCDTVQNICVGDSCYQQQLCDTILIPRTPATIYQNLLWKNGSIVEAGDPLFGTQASMHHDTYFNTGGYELRVQGAATLRPVLSVKQNQWSQLSPSIMGLYHYGKYPPTLLDANNPVGLYFNYTDPFMVPTTGGLAGDTLGYLGIGEYGYMLMTNAKGGQANFAVDDYNAKQVGISMYTYGTSTKGVGIFANKLPSAYNYGNNPAADSTLNDAMIAVFNTDKSTNFLGRVYLTNGRLEPDTAQITAANNLTLGNGNVFLVSGNTQINAITTSGWQAGSSPIHLVFSGTPTVKNNTAGGAGTATILLAGRTDFTAAAGDVLSLLFDGTNWYETNRSLAAGSAITADNGASTSTSTNVRLGSDNTSGSPLLHDTYINTSSFILNVSDIGTGYTANKKVFQVINAGSTFNTTGGNLTSFLGYFNNTALRTSGANNLTNIGVYSTATGGQINYAGYFDGDVNIVGTNAAISSLRVSNNSIGAASIVDISSTSTAAASNSQKGLNIALSGTNATSSQLTYAGYFSNTHDGTSSNNYGIYSTATGGTSINYAVYGKVSGGNIALYGDDAGGNGWGVFAETATGVGVHGESSSSGYGVEGVSATGFGVRGVQSGNGGIAVKAETSLAAAGTAYGIQSLATGTATDNIAGYFQATNATNNYAIIVPSGSGNVGIGTTTPSSAALLELSSTTQAFIVMRMTATQGSAITPAAGMIIFVTNTNGTFTSVGFWGYDGSAWAKF